MEDMPLIVTTVVVALLILVIGSFAFFVVTSEIGLSERQSETFAVDDSTVSQTFTLDWSPETIVQVQQYNGYAWENVSSAHYTLSGSEITILPGGMQG